MQNSEELKNLSSHRPRSIGFFIKLIADLGQRHISPRLWFSS